MSWYGFLIRGLVDMDGEKMDLYIYRRGGMEMENSKSRHEEPAIKCCSYGIELHQLNADEQVHAIRRP